MSQTQIVHNYPVMSAQSHSQLVTYQQFVTAPSLTHTDEDCIPSWLKATHQASRVTSSDTRLRLYETPWADDVV